MRSFCVCVFTVLGLFAAFNAFVISYGMRTREVRTRSLPTGSEHARVTELNGASDRADRAREAAAGMLEGTRVAETAAHVAAGPERHIREKDASPLGGQGQAEARELEGLKSSSLSGGGVERGEGGGDGEERHESIVRGGGGGGGVGRGGGGGGGVFARLGSKLPSRSPVLAAAKPSITPPVNNTFDNSSASRQRFLPRRKASLQFIHIPKNAGTAVTESGKQFGVYWASRFWQRKLKTPQLVQTRNGTCSCPWWHHPLWSLKKQSLVKKNLMGRDGRYAHTFCVVRDPRTRIGSILAQHLIPELKLLAQGMLPPTRLQQIELLRDILLRRIPEEPCFGFCHFLPQHEFVFSPEGERVCEHVLYFENLKNEFPELMEAHNMSDVKLMDSVNEMYIQKLRWNQLPDDVRHAVWKVYAKDFETFYPGALDKPISK